MVRPASVDKPEFAEFAERGAVVKPLELSEPSEAVVQALTGMDVVISCLTLRALREEMNLVDAASAARVGRYVPSFFGPCCPPQGVSFLREKVRCLIASKVSAVLRLVREFDEKEFTDKDVGLIEGGHFESHQVRLPSIHCHRHWLVVPVVLATLALGKDSAQGGVLHNSDRG